MSTKNDRLEIVCHFFIVYLQSDGKNSEQNESDHRRR